MTEDPRRELRALTAALRAHVEWQANTGAVGLPAGRLEEESTGTYAAVSAAPEGGDDDSGTSARPHGDSQQEGMHAPAPAGPQPKEPPVATLEREDARVRLATLAETVAGCTRCALHAARTQTVFSRGDGSSGLCFVGEGPGADEDAQGQPFVGKAGQLLDRMITAMGFTREEVYVCNIVKCRPPKNRKPEPDEMSECRPYLEEQLELIAPKVIVALGATAVQGLLGVGGGITRLRGEWRLYRGQIPVMPTFHPAFLLRQPTAKRDVWNDLQAVLTHMGREPPPRGR